MTYLYGLDPVAPLLAVLDTQVAGPAGRDDRELAGVLQMLCHLGPLHQHHHISITNHMHAQHTISIADAAEVTFQRSKNAASSRCCIQAAISCTREFEAQANRGTIVFAKSSSPLKSVISESCELCHRAIAVCLP